MAYYGLLDRAPMGRNEGGEQPLLAPPPQRVLIEAAAWAVRGRSSSA